MTDLLFWLKLERNKVRTNAGVRRLRTDTVCSLLSLLTTRLEPALRDNVSVAVAALSYLYSID